MARQQLTSSLQDTLALFTAGGPPLTTSEVAKRLELGRRSTYDRLDRLVDHGALETKKVGAKGRIWWQPTAIDSGGESATDRRSLAESLVEEILDGVDVGVVVLDDADEIVWTNRTIESYFGLDRGRLRGRDKRTVLEETIAPVVEDSTAFRKTVLDTDAGNPGIEDFECHVTASADREERWLEYRSNPIDSGPFAGGRVELYYDITDQEPAEQTQTGQHEQFESLVEAVDEYAIFMLDSDGCVRTWNTGAEQIKGYEADNIIGEHVSIFHTETDHREGVAEQTLDAARAEGSVEREGWQVRADGSRFWAHVTITALHDDEGELTGYAKVTRDMTDRREREAQLRRERDLTDRLLETVPVRLAIFEPDGSLDRINERARRKIGLEETPSSEFRLEDLDVTDADGRPMPTVEHPVSTVIETEEPVSDRVVQHEDPEGNTHWLTLNAAPLFDETGTLERVVVAGKDITTERRARRQVERQREDLKTELDEIFDRIDDGFLAIDDDWICTHINEQAAAMLGRSAGDLVGQNIWEEFPEATEYSFRQQYERALQTQESVSFEEYYDPLDTWYELTAYPSKTGLSVYFRDITERKERERELEQYRAIVETVEDGIYAVDSDNRFRLVNDAFCDLTGHDRAELLGAHVTEVYDENGGFVSSSPAPGVTPDQQEVTNIELEVETQSGESIPCETRLVPISLDEEQGWCGVIRDVTDHREFQETLTALYDSACKLLAADSTAEVSDVVVETATDVLDFSGVGTYIANEQRTCLSPTARSIEAGFIREPLPTVAADDSSITGHVYQTGKTRRFDDIRTSEYLQSNATEMRAGMFAPMGEHGVLIIGSRAVGEFGPQEQRLVELLAANARAAYDRVERDQRLQRRIEQQKVVTELGAQGLAKRSIDTLLAAASRQVSETLDTDYCKVLDLDDSGAELTLRQGVGWDDGIVGSATVSATEDDSQAAYTLRTSEPVVVSALETETRFSGPDLLTDHDVQSGISTTIGPPGDPWGILGTHDTASRDFTQHDVNFVQSVANVLGSAIVRHEDEQALLQQREQLAALNNLNEVVREITDAVIEQSTREEIESTVCERLADSDSYLFAWIGDVDAATNTVQLRTEAGVENYLEDIVISVDPDDERSEGATGRAFRSGEIRTTQDITVDERYEPWRDQIEEHSFRSSAAIPIVHDGTTYGMLNVYAERPYAFEGEERAVISQLGEIIGHAIAATERKQSLLGDELVALEFYVPSLYDSVDVDEPPTGRIEFEHVVPLSEDEFIVYGQVADDAVAYLEALAEALPHWGLVTVNSSDGDPRFELQLSTPPVLSEIASVGGVIDHAVIEDGDYHMAVHVSTTVDTRQIIDTVEEAYPAAQLLKHRQVSRETRSDSLDEIVTADLTDRQRTALRVAHRAGFFEWPRDVSGEDVAETLEITPPTFHQHLRNAERKIFEQLLSASTVEI